MESALGQCGKTILQRDHTHSLLPWKRILPCSVPVGCGYIDCFGQWNISRHDSAKPWNLSTLWGLFSGISAIAERIIFFELAHFCQKEETNLAEPDHPAKSSLNQPSLSWPHFLGLNKCLLLCLAKVFVAVCYASLLWHTKSVNTRI